MQVKEKKIHTLLKKEHQNKWVAFSPGYTKIIASGKTLKSTVSKITGKDKTSAVFHKVLPFSTYYEPTLL